LDELADYGVRLLKRCFKTSGRTTVDLVVLPVLLRQALVMLDSVALHLRNGAVYPAALPLRALFEANWSLEWILTQGRERWARQYHVGFIRRNRNAARAALAGTPENAALVELTQREVPGFELGNEKTEQIRNTLEACGRMLARPEYKDISDAFDRLRAERKLRHEPNWFQPSLSPTEKTPGSIRQMAATLGRTAEYDLIYTAYSSAVHGSSFSSHVSFESERMSIEPIRSAEGFKPNCLLAATVSLRTFRLVLEHYRPEELPAFAKTYVEQFQQRTMRMPDIQINPVYLDLDPL
jgi:hypothetical protein